MKLTPLGEMDLAYVGPMSLVDYGAGGQYYAHMEGTWRGDRISGKLRLTNLAQKREDNVNTPALRGVLETGDGANLYVEMNGISQIAQGGRAFINSLTLRTSDSRYLWANTLVAIVEGELQGSMRPGEVRARCWVFACEATMSAALPNDQRARFEAYAVPVPEGSDAHALAETHAQRQQPGIARESAFIQPMENGSQVIIYREFEDASASPDGGPATNESPRVELLLRQRPGRRGRIHATALPLTPGVTARLHEFALELGGIHAAEFEESLRRQGVGLTLLVQHLPELDLVIAIVEGDEPADALGRLAASQEPFDRWFIQQIGELTSGNPLALLSKSEVLWLWEAAARTQPAVAP